MKPTVVRGMRDLLGIEAARKQFVEDTCRSVFESYGFVPQFTPVVENFDTLAGKEQASDAIKNEIYYFKDKSERELGLRFDLTVPLARVVASNPAMAKPYKRYQIGSVYRYDRPGASRYREFSQADADSVGTDSTVADFECVAMAAEVATRLGLEVVIAINNQRLLCDLCEKSGVSEKQVPDALRILDKADKIGWPEVRRELAAKGIEAAFIDFVEAGELEVVRSRIADSTGLRELDELVRLCKQNGIENMKVDLSLARGMAYYTGNVFEVKTKTGPSIGGGGRYDKLVEVFDGPKTPAVGISFGIDRLVDQLENSAQKFQSIQVLVGAVGNTQNEALQVAQKLRGQGVATLLDLNRRSPSKNLELANKMNIPWVALVGENEIKSGRLGFKNMQNGKITELAMDLSDAREKLGR